MSTAETAFFFGSGGARLFGVLHCPPAAAQRPSAWVFCAPFGEEHFGAGRVAVEWARRLCGAGHPVLRFDYRGTGNSEGRFEDFTVDHYRADVVTAMEEVERRTGAPCRGLCGLRLGATLAALALEGGSRSPLLVLWEPIVRGEAYVDELLRVAMASEMLRAGGSPRTREHLRRRLADGGRVSYRGFAMDQASCAALAAMDLRSVSPPEPSAVLVVGITPRPRARSDLDDLCSAWARRGNVTRAEAAIPPPWSLANRVYDVRPEALFGPTLQWIERNAEPVGTVAATAAVPATAATDAAVEQPVSIPCAGSRMQGIMHVPPRVDPARPVIVMPVLSATFQVKLARMLGERGWASLRFDPRGKGDSEGHLGFQTITDLHFAVQNGLLRPDLEAAIDFLRRTRGTREVIPVGICGDALTAVLQADRDERVVAVAPLELPLFLVPRQAAGKAAREALRALLLTRMTWSTPPLWRLLDGWRSWRAWLRRTLRRCSPFAGGDPLLGDLGSLANVRLLKALEGCARREVPMLCLYGSARPAGPAAFERALSHLRGVAPGGARRVTFEVIEGADHHFSVPVCTDRVFTLLASWLDALHPADPREPRHPMAVPAGLPRHAR